MPPLRPVLGGSGNSGLSGAFAISPLTGLPEGFTEERLREIHRALVLPRMIEEKMLLVLRQGKLSKWFSGIGQEAIAVGVAMALQSDDWILPMHRNLGVFTARDFDLGPPLPPAPGPGRRLHQGPRPHVPLRLPREARGGHDQPPRAR